MYQKHIKPGKTIDEMCHRSDCIQLFESLFVKGCERGGVLSFGTLFFVLPPPPPSRKPIKKVMHFDRDSNASIRASFRLITISSDAISCLTNDT